MTTPEPQATEPGASDLGRFDPGTPVPWWWVGDAEWDSAYQARVEAEAEL